MSSWRSRIVGHEDVPPDQLLANPLNWRIHDALQQEATRASLDGLGWVREVLVNRVTGHVVDGHLRVTLALRNDQPTVPVTYVELTEEEERQALATLDPLAAMAGADADILGDLLAQIETEDAALQAVLDGLAEEVEIAGATELQGASGGGKLQLGDKQHQIKPVLYADQVGIFERALRATGIANRGEALIFVCKTFLDGHEEGSFDVQIQGIIEALASS